MHKDIQINDKKNKNKEKEMMSMTINVKKLSPKMNIDIGGYSPKNHAQTGTNFSLKNVIGKKHSFKNSPIRAEDVAVTTEGDLTIKLAQRT